mmetsp:Transcript_1139/g.1920  ORF Transcript_1139/g.1920 Transcript_1139/m.1920 type:complete len:437 (+) Transcript_1139:71-1381(+)|eukprot:CAMPEP_0169102124 /NCGR_PEP_ID=MMETSP1015-20121227/21999_1 /TAXON_ID=342587 /ORGANISM="Karlodinium micrum, Strain CCMP2283" /LENGTH=436 /DNA_ID=CAMNT_0009163203 /DNA_START=68 /DNA_END=1378 /DNA_ORIENTATION=-
MLDAVSNDSIYKSGLSRGSSGSARPVDRMLLFLACVSLGIRSSVAVHANERSHLMRRERRRAGSHLDITDAEQSNAHKAVYQLQKFKRHTAVVSSDSRGVAAEALPLRTSRLELPRDEDHKKGIRNGTISLPDLRQKMPRFDPTPVRRLHPTPLHRHRQHVSKSIVSSLTFGGESSGVQPLILAAERQAPAAGTAAPTAAPAPAATPTSPPAAAPAPATAPAPAPADSGGGGWLFFLVMVILIGGALVAIAFFVLHKILNKPLSSRLIDSSRASVNEESSYWKTAKHRQSLRNAERQSKMGESDHSDEEQSPRRARVSRKSYSQTRRSARDVDFGEPQSESLNEGAAVPSKSSYRGRRERAFSRSLSQPPEGLEGNGQSENDGTQNVSTPPLPARIRAQERREQERRTQRRASENLDTQLLAEALLNDDDDERLVV